MKRIGGGELVDATRAYGREKETYSLKTTVGFMEKTGNP